MKPSILILTLLAFSISEVSAQVTTFIRQPFLQKGAPTAASVCWRTNTAAILTVHYGTDSTNLSQTSSPSPLGTDACADLLGLQPFTKYFYHVYSGTTRLTGSPNPYFKTHPTLGSRQKSSFWIIGDAGTNTVDQWSVRDAYIKVNGGTHSDGLIMLGDNAYDNGTDQELTDKLFQIYPAIMANTFTWSCIGNHESYTSNGAPYLDAFSFPTDGHSGGVASGSELYYSFDYGNIHFISLASIVSSRSVTGPQYKWLQQDLQATTQTWIIVFFHHPPYTWGSHNSDTEIEHVEMRQNFLPLLEKYGVDLVYGGHSHDYERSFLLDSAYGIASDNLAKKAKVVLDGKSGNPTTTGPYLKKSRLAGHRGTVYTVDGSSGHAEGIIGLHPMHYVQLDVPGSVILTVEDSVATSRFYDKTGALKDQFQLIQSDISTQSISRGQKQATLTRVGRRFQFSTTNTTVFRLYTLGGKIVFSGTPKGNFELPVAEFSPGEYYFRFGATFEEISLP